MKKKKFKVGDIVTCTRENVYSVTTKGVKCEVVSIDSNGYTAMKVKVIDKGNPCYGYRFGVNSQLFKKVNMTEPFTTMVNGVYCKCTPIEDKKERTKLWVTEILDRLVHYKYRIVAEKKNTVVIISDDNWNTIKIGVARCADTDKYDYSIGEAVAAAKAMGEKIPDFMYE